MDYQGTLLLTNKAASPCDPTEEKSTEDFKPERRNLDLGQELGRKLQSKLQS